MSIYTHTSNRYIIYYKYYLWANHRILYCYVCKFVVSKYLLLLLIVSKYHYRAIEQMINDYMPPVKLITQYIMNE